MIKENILGKWCRYLNIYTGRHGLTFRLCKQGPCQSVPTEHALKGWLQGNIAVG